MESLNALIQGMGLMHLGAGQAVMLLVSLLLLWLAIAKKFEPLLLLPIGFGGLLSNIPEAGLALTALESLLAHHDPAQLAVIAAKLHCAPDVHAIKEALALALPSVQGQMESLAVDMGYSAGVLAIFYKVAIGSGIAPLVIFMGVGAMTDFGPLLANPRTLLLGAAAQFGIFATVLGALTLNYFGIISFTLPQAAAIGIIGGADGPTAIYLSGKLAPELLGAIAVAAYSYMALVPLIQPPIMKALTTDKERKIRMVQLRTVSKREKILFPAVLLLLVALLLPDAAPLLGMFCFGNLMRESGVVERLSDTVQNALINIVTIFLGLSVGAKLVADKFLQPQTLGILVLGVIAFCVGTAAGVLMAKLMNVFSRHKINPLIGSAGVSAVPMAARVSNKVGLEADGQNFLLMHAMGPNVAGVIGSAIARRGDAQVRAGDVSQPVPAAGKPAAEISHKETEMSETIIAEHTAVRINRTMLAGYLHQSLQQVCKLASGLKILRLPASDTTRRATILTEPVYAAARLRLAQQQPLAQNPLCDDVLRRFRHAPGLTADLPRFSLIPCVA
ncbi:oxaloacetate decarboxylase subunit beta [Klebsiella pneumoniae]|nr:oxaloacetate decarboxylase subunit beta [Klebsiella pneumoniae]